MQNFVLRKFGFQPKRQNQFLGLAPIGSIRFEKKILGELLCQRRTTLHHAARGEVQVSCTDETQGINPVVGPEAMVFDCDQGIGHIVGKFGHANLIAEKCALFGENSSVCSK